MKADELFAFPLSFAQERLWFLDQLAPHNPLYNIATTWSLRMPVDTALLERSLNEIISRHEVLRSVFAVAQDQPVQIVLPKLPIKLSTVRLGNLSASERKQEASRLANEEARLPFDLARGPLLRATLLTLAEQEHILVLVMHHIVSDTWSLELLFQELKVISTALGAGKPCPLPPLEIQYSDYAIWQREWLKSDILEKELSYWRRQLHDLPHLKMPLDYSRPPVQTFVGEQCMVKLPATLVAQLRALTRREGVTLFMTMLAGFQALLCLYSGQDDVAVGSPIAGRSRREVEPLIGFFVNTLVLRTDCSGNPTFRELLHRVRDMTLEAYANQDVPFEQLVEHLLVERDLSRNPLFQVLFQLRTVPRLPHSDIPYVPPVEINRRRATFDLSVSLWECDDLIEGAFEYNTDLFDARTIERMARHYESLLAAIVSNPDARIHELPLMDQAELSLMLSYCHGPEEPFARVCVQQLFEDQVRKTPEASAVVFAGAALSYKDLNARANRMARYLRTLNVGPEVIVGICLDRSREMIQTVLAVLKAGGAYLPLDPAYPQDRLQFMLADAKPSIVVTHSRFLKMFEGQNTSVISLDMAAEASENQDDEDLPRLTTADNLAYLMYTSGSTGTPKGVLVTHRGLSNVIPSQLRLLGVSQQDQVLQFASLTFDASIFEILLAFGAGATLHLGTAEQLMPGLPLMHFLRERGITVVTLPPSVLATLASEECLSVRIVLVAGEACTSELVSLWAPGRRFFNLYGPTEATIWTTAAACTAGYRAPTIGKPIPNVQVYILDRNRALAPLGVPGEIHIGGCSLARGYLNRQALTCEKFIANPLKGHGDERLYKTGDLARYLSDGRIEFVGRLDQQVKIRGFRVELGEIEATIKTHPSVQDAVVIQAHDKSGIGNLIAHVVPGRDSLIVKAQLEDWLRSRLPAFMIPQRFIFLQELPRLPSGKVSRRALLGDLSRHRIGEASEYRTPRNELDQCITTIWKEVLNIDRPSIEDNFFDVGGNSLFIARVQLRLRAATGKEIPMIELFRHPTIRSLADYLNGSSSKELTIVEEKGAHFQGQCVPVSGEVATGAVLDV